MQDRRARAARTDGVRRLLTVCATAVAFGACGGEQPKTASAPPIAIGVRVPGATELRAANPGSGSALMLEDVRRPGMHPRDVCFVLALERQPRAEADEHCIVEDPGGDVVELGAAKGVPEALGPPIAIVAGHAGAAVRKLLLEVAGESHQLPLSPGRGFLALLPASYRGTVALVARKADGTVSTQSFALPRPLVTQPTVRRPGAVVDGEIGEDVIGERESDLRRRLGAPAARRGSCLFYQQVGRPRGGWELCLRHGRVSRARWHGS
ncbi:MAG: hypothetical protein QOD71_3302 [Thermoleophilaceae bacterium]|jgi:hypothetical protein|nr:hypothetical protein [Thermoleophilaceae bacterium]